MSFKRFAVAAPAVVAFMFSASVFSTAEAKQCVKSEAGYIAKVSWYDPATIKLDDKGEKLLPIKPVQQDKITLGFSSCIEKADPHLAVIEVVDGDIAVTFGRALTVLSGIYWGPACAAGDAASCKVKTEFDSDGLNSFKDAIPDAKGMFYADVPSPMFELKIWGTVSAPQSGPGAIIPAYFDPMGPIYAMAFNSAAAVPPTYKTLRTVQNVTEFACVAACTKDKECRGFVHYDVPPFPFCNLTNEDLDQYRQHGTGEFFNGHEEIAADRTTPSSIHKMYALKFKVTEGAAQAGHNDVVREGIDLGLCLQVCTLDASCKSVDYNFDTRHCDMSKTKGATAAGGGGLLKSAAWKAWTYYEKK